MKLFYITNTRIPSERASSYQVMQMCAAFAANKATVDLLYPRRRVYGQWGEIDNAFDYYGSPESFAMHSVPCVDPLKTVTIDQPKLRDTPLPQLSHYLQAGTFALNALRSILTHRAGICYARDISFLSLLRAADPQNRWRLFYEAHTVPETSWSLRQARWLAPRLDGIVTITESIHRFFVGIGAQQDSVLTAPDGVDLARYLQLPSKEIARASLDLPPTRPLICYTGQLYRWKGVHTLIAAMASLSEATLCLVGGSPAELSETQAEVRRQGATNIIITGHVTPKLVPLYQVAADVLVLPNTARETISREHTSPLKLFEYMATRRPIIASDLPSLREVLRHGENAWLVKADDPLSLAQGIQHVLTKPDLAAHLASQAQREVQTFTWDRRASQILKFLKAHAIVGD